MTHPRWLTTPEERAWRGYRRMRTRLDLQLARDLSRDSGLSESDYDVLSHLSEAEGARLRLKDLADRMLWSKSRLSHHITRMEHRGLVAREECPTDARGAFVALTDAGVTAIEAAAPGHVESVRRHLIDPLTAEQVHALGDLTHAVLAHLADPDSLEDPAPGEEPAAGRGLGPAAAGTDGEGEDDDRTGQQRPRPTR